MASRRLEDRIRELLDKAISTSDSTELNVILQDLNYALREHSKRLRKLVTESLIKPNRRARS